MEDRHFKQLKDHMTERLDQLTAEALNSKEKKREVIHQAFEQMKSRGLLNILSAEEVCLLEDFRVWRLTPGKSVTGVFHWKARSK